MARAVKNKNNKLLVVLIIVVIVVVAAIAIYNSLMGSVTLSEPVMVTIEEGYTTSQIGDVLAEAGVVKSATGFKLYVKKENVGSNLQTGRYEFSGETSLADVVEVLQTHSTLGDIKVTIPEGLNMKQTAARWAEACEFTAEEFLDYATNAQFDYHFLPAAGSENRVEGFLFPETYIVGESTTAQEAVEMMLAQFASIWTDEFQARADALGMTTYEVITMASLVEREAEVESDRPIISGVFYNRLAVDMPLQSCASIQYILGEQKAKLTNADLQIVSPYNTYLNGGLPPGPIASPGLASIEAALYPTESDYLYFLAKPDGSHYFSKTYAEHLQAKAKYID